MGTAGHTASQYPDCKAVYGQKKSGEKLSTPSGLALYYGPPPVTLTAISNEYFQAHTERYSIRLMRVLFRISFVVIGRLV
jgi:hypothetical protein